MAEGKLGSFLNFFKIDEEDDLDINEVTPIQQKDSKR